MTRKGPPRLRRPRDWLAGTRLFAVMVMAGFVVVPAIDAAAHAQDTRGSGTAAVNGPNDPEAAVSSNAGAISRTAKAFEPLPGLSLAAIDYSDLTGWSDDDLTTPLAAFLRGCGGPAARTASLGVEGNVLAALCREAEEARSSPTAARAFFEHDFLPLRIEREGFVTGYFEPAIAGSRTRTSRFSVPLYRRPDDLVKIDESQRGAAREAGLPEEYAFARRTAEGALAEYPDRAAIEAGALGGRGLEIAWVEDPLDAFFIHIQGSARIQLRDGSVMRIAYAAKSGQAYTPIGRILIERGEIARDDMTMERLRSWLEAHPDETPALMARNRSYIFFREVAAEENEGPIGAAGVPLSAGRSLAVDRRIHTFGTPVFVEGTLPLGTNGVATPFARLMIAQDTGSAIVGPARGDIFVGTGEEAGRIAGRIKHPVTFTLLVPRASALARRALSGAMR